MWSVDPKSIIQLESRSLDAIKTFLEFSKSSRSSKIDTWSTRDNIIFFHMVAAYWCGRLRFKILSADCQEQVARQRLWFLCCLKNTKRHWVNFSFGGLIVQNTRQSTSLGGWRPRKLHGKNWFFGFRVLFEEETNWNLLWCQDKSVKLYESFTVWIIVLYSSLKEEIYIQKQRGTLNFYCILTNANIHWISMVYWLTPTSFRNCAKISFWPTS